MTYSIVYASDVQKAKRFDAEYFKPEYLKIERKLERMETDFLFNLANSEYQTFTPSTKHEYFEYIEIAKVNLITGEYGKEKILNNEQPSRAKKICNQFDLLVSTVRPNRNAISLILEDKKSLIASTGFCKLSCQRVNPYFLFILLKTNIYVKLLDRKTTATQYPAINEDDIVNLKIPLLSQAFQGEIERIVKCAHEAQSQSRQLYKDAETLLLKELGFLGYEPQHRRSFTTTKREVDSAQRCDAEYFQPKYAEIIEKIKGYKGGFDIVQNIVSWKKGIEVGSEQYTEHGKAFIRVSDFSIHGVKETSKKISEQLFQETQENYQPQKGDILFTKDGTIGICNVLTQNIEGVVSSAFLRLNAKNAYKSFEKECFALILNSIVCKLQVEQLSGGAIIAHLKPSDFETFKIPLIDASIQADIAEKIRESHRLRKHSKDLLHTATQAVELAIEQNEAAAFAFLA